VFDLDFTVDDLKKIDFEKLFLVLVLKKIFFWLKII